MSGNGELGSQVTCEDLVCSKCDRKETVCAEKGPGLHQRILWAAQQKGWDRAPGPEGGWLCNKELVAQGDEGAALDSACEGQPVGQGAVALCSQNSLGFITSKTPRDVVYPGGKTGRAWTGIHLTNKIAPIGSPWSSRNPAVMFYLNDHLARYLHGILKHSET